MRLHTGLQTRLRRLHAGEHNGQTAELHNSSGETVSHILKGILKRVLFWVFTTGARHVFRTAVSFEACGWCITLQNTPSPLASAARFPGIVMAIVALTGDPS